jgi:phage tail tape-measure protein
MSTINSNPNSINSDDIIVDDNDANRDPISGQPGAHPVGTGIGAAGIGTAATAIGAVVGGPVGAAVGTVVGSVVGGLAGKATAEKVDPTDPALG